ncbi:MAG: response regulator [Gemmatimonadales bacterium]
MAIRAVVADDDRASRKVVSRLLQQLRVEAVEAANGLEVLAALEAGNDIELLILDLDMPVLNGVETLKAIRSAPQYRELPVICVSSVDDGDIVSSVVSLGVANFILKPFQPDDALARIRNTLAARGGRRHRGPIDTSELLAVDPDPNFLAMLRALFEGRHEVMEAPSGPRAAALFQGRRSLPGIVLVAEGLQVLDEIQLASTLRQIAEQRNASPPAVYLMTSGEPVPEERARHFAGVIRKSFVPEQFRSSFERVVMGAVSPAEKLQSLVEGEMDRELGSALQQAIGIILGQELTALPAEELPGLELTVRASLTLGGGATSASLVIALLSDPTSVANASAKMLGSAATAGDGGADVLGELATNVAGRIRASLVSRGVDLEMGLPTAAVEDAPVALSECDRCLGFRSPGGDTFVVGLTPSVTDPEAQPELEPEPEPQSEPAPEPEPQESAQ